MRMLRLVADDLTGALDSAAQFTALAGPLPVLLDPAVPAPEGSFALDLSCRDGARERAVAATRAALPVFAGADLAFKKIDSLMRGHWAAEIAAIVRAGIFERIVLAPAFPAQRRITMGGRQMLAGADGPSFVAEPAADLAREGIHVRDASAEGGQGTAVLVLDASTDADLDAIVARYLGRPSTLWCGAAGLARALAGHAAPVVQPSGSPHLVLVGSHHPVTKAQIAVLATAQPDWIVRFDADHAASAARIADVLARHGRCVALPDIPPGMAPGQAAVLIAAWMGGLCRLLPPPAVLSVVGGETFAALCASLGASILTVEGDSEPGVPASRMTSGRWAGTLCFSKSGAFGAPGWLAGQVGVPAAVI